MRDEEQKIRVENCLLCMQRHSWEQGVAMQAFLENGQLEKVILMANEAVCRSRADGRAAVIGENEAVTDPCAVGEALIAACRETADPRLLEGKQALLDWALNKAPQNERGILYHVTTGKQFWADSLYMLPPFLAAAGHYDEALSSFYGYWNVLYDPQKRLIRHMWDEEKREFIRAACWGGGNGWALAAAARMARLLPGERYGADIRRIEEMARELLEGVLHYMRPDGLFHDIVDDPSTFVETNLAQMTAYTIYRGLGDGWLEGSLWRERAELMRQAAHAKVDALGFVRGVCGAPTFDKPGTSPEGQAFYLLVEAARAKGK